MIEILNAHVLWTEPPWFTVTAYIVWFTLGTLVPGVLLRLHFIRAESCLQQWAQSYGYRVLSRSYRIFLRGPFGLGPRREQVVYRVRLEDWKGHQQQGWVRLKNFWNGFQFAQVDLKWDEIITGA